MHPFSASRHALPMRNLVIAMLCAFGATGIGGAHAQGAALESPESSGANAPVKIGIIGTGRIGGTLARYWVRAGHEVFVSSRHPEELQGLVKELGPRAHAGTPLQAAQFGTVVLVSVPYSAMPELERDVSAALAGKVIIDTSNPVSGRDGAVAQPAQKLGAGLATAQYLHNQRIVRAFNCIPAATLASESNRQPERIAIPIGGDDTAALRIAVELVRETGFDPIVVGSLARTRLFDLGQPLAHGDLTANELRRRLGQLRP
jgi:8-hydroxy-5-deazaflavin:NADPH oxidoreductase